MFKRKKDKNPDISSKEMVRIAYNLILGREPENDYVLDRQFNDYHELRDQLMNSDEFINIIEGRAESKKNNKIVGTMDVVDINLPDSKFLWCVSSDSTDPISENARQGKVTFDTKLFDLFPETGTFIDIGANIGAFSLSLAAKGWNGYSFEASSKNSFVLKSSIAINGFDVKVVGSAVLDKSGKINFFQHGPYGVVQNEAMSDVPYEEIDCICLDDWINSNKIEKVDLIKIDIEGSEVAALRGMKRFLDKYGYPPVYIEGNAYTLKLHGESISSMLSLTACMGYKAYEMQDGGLCSVDESKIPEYNCADFLLVKDTPPSFAKTI